MQFSEGVPAEQLLPDDSNVSFNAESSIFEITCIKQKAQLSLRDLRSALFQWKYWSTVVGIMQQISVILRSTFSNYNVLFCYLHSFVHASLHQAQISHRQYAMRCMSPTDIHTANLVGVNWAVIVISQSRLLPMLLMTSRIVSVSALSRSWTTMVDTHKFSVLRCLNQRLLNQS